MVTGLLLDGVKRRLGRVPIAKITGQGLAAIGLSVALLWGCVLGEREMVRQAHLERARVMRDVVRVQHQRQRPIPVFAPTPAFAKHIPATAG